MTKTFRPNIFSECGPSGSTDSQDGPNSRPGSRLERSCSVNSLSTSSSGSIPEDMSHGYKPTRNPKSNNQHQSTLIKPTQKVAPLPEPSFFDDNDVDGVFSEDDDLPLPALKNERVSPPTPASPTPTTPMSPTSSSGQRTISPPAVRPITPVINMKRKAVEELTPDEYYAKRLKDDFPRSTLHEEDIFTLWRKTCSDPAQVSPHFVFSDWLIRLVSLFRASF